MADNLSAGTQYHVMVDSDAYTVMSEFTPTSSNATSYQSEAALEDEFIRILTSQGYDYLGGGAENGRSLRSRPRLLALRVSSPPQVPEGTCGPSSSILRVATCGIKKRAPLLGVHGHLWWRCGESNSGPKHIPGGFLQAQLLVGIRSPCT